MATKKAIIMESKKKVLKEEHVKFTAADMEKLEEILKLAGEIGLVTVKDITNFLNREAKPGDTVYSALKKYRDELGDDFELKMAEAFEKLEACNKKKEKTPLKEDKYYISEKDAEDDFMRLSHYLSVNGYSEIPYNLYAEDDLAQQEVAATIDDTIAAEENALAKGKLGYISAGTNGAILVTAASEENLTKAREIAADFDCPIDNETVSKNRAGQKTYTITIDPFSGYEFGTPECEAAMSKYTPANQAVYQKRADARKARATLADGSDEILDEFDDDLDESCKPELKETYDETPLTTADTNIRNKLESMYDMFHEGSVDGDAVLKVLSEIEQLLDKSIDKFNKELKEEFEEPLVACSWCKEEFPEDELKETELGLLCDQCVAGIESKEGPMYKRAHSCHESQETDCTQIKCEECGKECDQADLVEEIDLGHICKECVAKHRRLGESLTFIKKIQK